MIAEKNSKENVFLFFKNTHYALSLLFLVCAHLLFAQDGTSCMQSNPFCSDQSYNFPNATTGTAPAGPAYGCLTRQPRPIWYFMKIGTSGTIKLDLQQHTGPNRTGSQIDVDFALWGPFSDLTTGCSQVMSGNNSPLQCSYSSSYQETIGIGVQGGTSGGTSTPPAAVRGQYYIVLLTNYDGAAGFISFNQVGGTGATDCSIVEPCHFTSINANVGSCNAANNTFNITGTVVFTGQPETGQLVIKDCNNNQVTLNAPFSSPLNFTLPNVPANGASCSLQAYFSADPTCSISSSPYTNAPACDCRANAGTFTNTVAGSSNSTGTSIELCYNDRLNITSNNNYTYPANVSNPSVAYEPGMGLAVFSCPPVVSPPAALNSDPCFVGIISPVTNPGWTLTNTDQSNTSLYYVPVTLYNTSGSVYSGTSPVYCYGMGTAVKVTNLKEITTTVTNSCQTGSVSVVINGGMPAYNGSAYTLSNLSPANASFSSSSITNGGTVTVSGLTDGQVFSFTVTDTKGCSKIVTGTFVGPENSSFSYPKQNYCQDETPLPVASVTGLAGGTFSAPSGLVINPATGEINTSTSTPGTYTVSYISSASPCNSTSTRTVTIHPKPVISANSGAICIGNIMNITASGADTYSWSPGTGLNATTGNAVIANPTVTTTYTIQGTSTAGCINTQTLMVVVNPLPTPSIMQSGPFCIDAGTATLSASPSGGTFTGTGITGSDFNPGTAGAGSHVITYTYTDANSCTNSTTSTIVVNPLPTPSITQSGPFCIDAGTATLSASPVGGTFTGTGMTGSDFNPGTAGAGSHVITYTYTDANSCTNSTTSTIVVNPLPTPSITQSGPFCIDAGTATLSASPSGGTFTGTGITGSDFNPGTAGAGSHVITYTYTDANSCTNSTTSTIVVNPLPTPSITQSGPFCIDAGTATLAASPVGGTFTGIGMTGSDFNPGTAGAGSHVITYTYTDANSCTNSTTSTIVVNPLPTPSITQSGPFCIDAGTATLSASPSGGTFTGTGITGSDFNPATSGAGSHVITYTYTDANSCTNSTTSTIVVNPLPTPSITQSGPFCIDAGTATLAASPVGGTFTGTGITGSDFNPGTAGAGSHVITYTYTDANSCTNSTTSTIVVNPLPTPSITQVGPFCIDAGTATLSASPSGGTFTGTGMTGSDFNPGTAGAGSHVITYTYTDANSCTNSTTSTIVVNPLPTPSITQAGPFCIDAGTATLSASPVGGTYTGTGVTGSDFNPATSGAGSHVITYTYTDANSCTNYTTSTIVVNPLPTPSITQAGPFCQNEPSYTLTATPSGGTFSGMGMTGSDFNATTAGAGSHVITYTYTDVNSCTNSTTSTIIVNSLPTATITGTITLCQEDQEPLISFEGANTVAPYIFSYTINGGTVQTVTSSGNTATVPAPTVTPGTYVYDLVSVQDASSTACINLQNGTVTVVIKPLPDVTVTPVSASICSNESTAITMTSGLAGTVFDWTVSQNDATGASAGTGASINQVLTAIQLTAGTVTYTVVPENNGCIGTSQEVIYTIKPLPTVLSNLPSNSICSGDQTNFILTSQPAGASFAWTENTTNVTGATGGAGTSIQQTLTATTTGQVTYSITPSLDGCIGSLLSLPVTVNPLPVLTVSPLAPVICSGSSTSLTATGASTYLWSPAAGLNVSTGASVIASPAQTQLYTVTGTDIHGCIGTTTVNVTVNPMPVVNVTQDMAICAGESTDLTVTGADSYYWGPSTGLSSTTGNRVVASPSSTITYTVTGTTLNCSTNATVTVTVHQLPLVNGGPDVQLCQGENLTLSANGASTYTWDNGVMNGIAFEPAAGTAIYTVTGTDINGCQNTDEVTITVIELPVVMFTPSAMKGCTPMLVKFSNRSEGAYSYQWNFGDGTTSTQQNPEHTYYDLGCFDVTLTASTIQGCTSTLNIADLICTELSPVAAFVASKTEIETNNSLVHFLNQSSNSTHYEWYFSDSQGHETDESPSHEFTINTNGDYFATLVAKNASQCTDTAKILIRSKPGVIYYIPNAFTPDGDNYNQVFKPVFTEGFDPMSYELKVFNRWGEVIFESHDARYGWDGSYSGTSQLVQDGVYTWRISFKKAYNDEKIVETGHVTLIR